MSTHISKHQQGSGAVSLILKLALLLLVCLFVAWMLLLQLRKRTLIPSTQTITPTQVSPTARVANVPQDLTASEAAVFSPFDEALQKEEELNEMRLRPDITIANYAPLETEMFSVDVEYVSVVPSYFRIIVTAKPDAKDVKADFAMWLKDIGIPDDVVYKLEVVYR